jgi:glycosyltransferase involved in cell wall biosynthesis
LKILHVAPNAYPFTGGIEVLLRNLALYEKKRGENELLIAFPDRSHIFDSQFSIDGTRVIPMKVLLQKPVNPLLPKPVYRPSEIVEIFSNYRNLLLTEKPDVVHLHDYSEASLPVISVAKSLGIPLIQHLHILITSAFPDDLINNFKNLTNFIAVSHAAKDALDQAIGRESNAIVVPNGIPEVPDETLALTKDDSNIILCVGRCVPSKGFNRAFNILESLLKSGIECRLEFIGAGPTLSHLKVETTARSLDSRVSFYGLLDRDVVLQKIRTATVLLVPSESEEGFGLVVAEAGACKTPVVATKIGGLVETVEDGVNGYSRELNDEPGLIEAIAKIITNPQLAKELGEAGYLRFQRMYGIKEFAAKVDSLYQLALLKGTIR